MALMPAAKRPIAGNAMIPNHSVTIATKARDDTRGITRQNRGLPIMVVRPRPIRKTALPAMTRATQPALGPAVIMIWMESKEPIRGYIQAAQT